jgi:nucleotide-binding universal stress UspA family protein
MRRSGDRPFSIVVGFDFSELGELALAESLGLASLNQRTVLHILGVLDVSDGLGPVRPARKSHYDTAEQVQAEIKKVVEAKIQAYDPSQFRFYIHARIGEPAEEIIRVADEAYADLIVIGTHGRSGIERLLLGSVSERVVRHAGCPVLVMRPKRAPASAEADADADAYQPEPACAHCVVRRLETDGAEWWCAEHAKTYVQPHRYSYSTNIGPIEPDDWTIFNK